MFFTRRRIIIILSVVLLLLILAVLFDSALRKQAETSPEPETTLDNINPTESLPVTDDIPEPLIPDRPVTSSASNPEVEQSVPAPVMNAEFSEALRTGRVFIERFGSFSNQANYQNIEDVLGVMTVSMQNWAQSIIKKGRSNDDIGNYFGINTKVISHKVVSETSDTTVIMFTTQRHELGGSAGDMSYYQDAEVTLKKIDNKWLVDSSYWQEKHFEI